MTTTINQQSLHEEDTCKQMTGKKMKQTITAIHTPIILSVLTLRTFYEISGVFGMPKCPGANYTLCEWMRELLDLGKSNRTQYKTTSLSLCTHPHPHTTHTLCSGAYISWIQDTLVQAEYWHVRSTLLFPNH